MANRESVTENTGCTRSTSQYKSICDKVKTRQISHPVGYRPADSQHLHRGTQTFAHTFLSRGPLFLCSQLTICFPAPRSLAFAATRGDPRQQNLSRSSLTKKSLTVRSTVVRVQYVCRHTSIRKLLLRVNPYVPASTVNALKLVLPTSGFLIPKNSGINPSQTGAQKVGQFLLYGFLAEVLRRHPYSTGTSTVLVRGGFGPVFTRTGFGRTRTETRTSGGIRATSGRTEFCQNSGPILPEFWQKYKVLAEVWQNSTRTVLPPVLLAAFCQK